MSIFDLSVILAIYGAFIGSLYYLFLNIKRAVGKPEDNN